MALEECHLNKNQARACVAAGHEVIQYVPTDDFSNLYDINDLMSAYQTTFDPPGLDNTVLSTPVDEENLETLYLTQPNTSTQNGRRTEMQDVD